VQVGCRRADRHALGGDRGKARTIAALATDERAGKPRIAIVNPLAYYTEQSAVTDPGEMAPVFADLPADIPTLRRIARGLVIHYRADDLAAAGIPDERME
jgi:hypothetical protein